MINELIKNHYVPVQPTLTGNDQAVYRAIEPENQLAGLINCYWEMSTREKLEKDFVYRVIADGCIDIFWEATHPQELFVMGLASSYTEFPLSNEFKYFGIRFLPMAFPLLFKISAAELTNRFENLEQVLPNQASYLSQVVYGLVDLSHIGHTLNAYFLNLLGGISLETDERLTNAVATLLKTGGNISITKDINTGLSPRQLRRLFHHFVGESPKAFSKIIRFQKFLLAKPSAQSLRASKMYFDQGYYDQAHFIKEFKHLYGMTPGQALGT